MMISCTASHRAPLAGAAHLSSKSSMAGALPCTLPKAPVYTMRAGRATPVAAATPPATRTAYYCDNKTPGGKLQVGEIPNLIPEAGEVLVEVKAAGVNALDWNLAGFMKGVPPFIRQAPYVAGRDVAGVVAQCGPGVWKDAPKVALLWDFDCFPTFLRRIFQRASGNSPQPPNPVARATEMSAVSPPYRTWTCFPPFSNINPQQSLKSLTFLR
mmetsp:Transcript_18264/g.59079  ORF Transcript_18264/g.59079 Transcript_18264/m.59079 type:complete len:213 (+) Transcript_18264:33-671(+)